MAKNSEKQAMLANMMDTFGSLAAQQRRETVKKEEEKNEKKIDIKPKEELKPVKKEELEKIEKPVVNETKVEVKEVLKAEPVVKEKKKPVVAGKKKKTPKDTVLGIVAKGYEFDTSDEKKKQTSIYLSEDAIKALDEVYLELSKSVKIKKSDIMALLVKDFDSLYDGKNNEVFEIALDYNDKDLKRKVTNWTPSKEMKDQLVSMAEKFGLKRLKMKYNDVCDMILLHYLK